MGKKTGRSTVIGIDELRKLRQAFLMGFTDREACIYTEIAERTFYDFQTKYPEVSHLKEEWKENPILKARATIYKEIEKGETAKWFLERKKKNEFAPRQELTGEGGAAIPIKLEYIMPVKEEVIIDGTEQPTDPNQPNPAPAIEAVIQAPQDGVAVPQDPVQTDPQTTPSVADPNGPTPQ